MGLDDLFHELFHGLPQQGPGNEECTLRALDAVGPLPASPRILDVGCGTGRQTLVLAGRCGGSLVAVDSYPDSLAELDEQLSKTELESQVETQLGSMTELRFPAESFDLIWSEGAIYNMGFERGLSEWRHLLRPGCCLAVTELSWLNANPPKAAESFWRTEYPGMASREQNIESALRANYQLVETFSLPDTTWWDYYNPLEEQIARLRSKYASAENAKEVAASLDLVQREIDVFRACEGSYSYVFYIMRRPA